GLELPDVDDGVFDTKRIVEAALRQSALQGHLTAFVSRRSVATGAGAASLVAFAGGLAVPGAGAAADALALPRSSCSGSQITQVHLALYLDEVAHRSQPPSHGFVVAHDHRLTQAGEPQRPQRLPLALRSADRAADECDFQHACVAHGPTREF